MSSELQCVINNMMALLTYSGLIFNNSFFVGFSFLLAAYMTEIAHIQWIRNTEYTAIISKNWSKIEMRPTRELFSIRANLSDNYMTWRNHDTIKLHEMNLQMIMYIFFYFQMVRARYTSDSNVISTMKYTHNKCIEIYLQNNEILVNR